MNKAQPFIAIAAAVLLAVGLAAAVNPGSQDLLGVPAFGLCIAISFLIQWVVFVPAYLARSEKFFDLTGSITFISVGALAISAGGVDLRSAVIVALVTIWAVRLGTFLAVRVHRAGFDRRFDRIKQSLPVFLMTWTLQGLWVSVTYSAGLAAITSTNQVPFGIVGVLGVAVWMVGFAIEVVADRQKTAFRANPDNAERFITTGLWSRSRHPNYFGEITLWIGVAIVALPALSGWQLVTLASPLFIWVLLTKISGVRMLEGGGHKRWGEDRAYQEYVKSTPVLIPRVF